MNAHVTIGGIPLCNFPMEGQLRIADKARALRIPPCCGHGSVRNAVIIATLLDEAGVGNGNVHVKLGGCPTDAKFRDE